MAYAYLQGALSQGMQFASSAGVHCCWEDGADYDHTNAGST